MYSDEATTINPSHDREVRAELQLLIVSSELRSSKRCKAFVEHIVERTIAGRNDSLKERAIGVELFKFPPGFDTGQHTAVRLTANEVRKKLAQFYLALDDAPHSVR